MKLRLALAPLFALSMVGACSDKAEQAKDIVAKNQILENLSSHKSVEVDKIEESQIKNDRPHLRDYMNSDRQCFYIMQSQLVVGVSPDADRMDTEMARQFYSDMVVKKFGKAAVSEIINQEAEDFYQKNPETKNNSDYFKAAINGGAKACVKYAKIDYASANPN